MPLSLAALPPEIIESVLVLLAPRDIISLGKCMPLWITKQVYDAAFNEQSRFSRYDMVMFKERARCKFWIWEDLKNYILQYYHLLPPNIVYAFQPPKMHPPRKVHTEEFITQASAYYRSIILLTSTQEVLLTKVSPPNSKDSFNEVPYMVTELRGRQQVEDNYSRGRSRPSINHHARPLPNTSDAASSTTTGTGSISSSESSAESALSSDADSSAGPSGSTGNSSDSSSNDEVDDPNYSDDFDPERYFLGSSSSSSSDRFNSSASSSLSSSSADIGISVRIPASSSDSGRTGSTPSSPASVSSSVIHSDSSSEATNRHDHCPPEVASFSRNFYNRPYRPTRFVKVFAGPEMIAIDDHGIVWMWERDKFRNNLGTPVCLMISGGKNVVAGSRIVEIAYHYMAFSFLIKGVGIVNQDQELYVQPNGIRSGYRCHNGRFCYIDIGDRRTPKEVRMFAGLSDGIVYLNTEGKVIGLPLEVEEPEFRREVEKINKFGPFNYLVGYDNGFVVIGEDGSVLEALFEYEGELKVTVDVLQDLRHTRVVSVAVGEYLETLYLTDRGDVYFYDGKKPRKLQLPGKVYAMCPSVDFCGFLVYDGK